MGSGQSAAARVAELLVDHTARIAQLGAVHPSGYFACGFEFGMALALRHPEYAAALREGLLRHVQVDAFWEAEADHLVERAPIEEEVP